MHNVMINKDNIKKDLEVKGADYLERNYLIRTRQNILRRLRRQLILEGLIELQKNIVVLDIGCGPAILFPEILKMSKEYVAVDLVKSNLEAIRKSSTSENLILVEADMDDFTWQHDYFDLIICSGAIEYSDHPNRNLLRLIAYLKKGGRMVCSFPNRTSPYRIWSEYVYRHLWQMKNALLRRKYYYYPRRLFCERKIIRLIKESSNPEELKVIYFGHKFILQPLDRLMGAIDYKLILFFHEHPARWTQPFCTEFLLWLKK